MGIFSLLFGKKADFEQLIKAGAQIVDVRTKNEFQGGHIKGAINIPLDQIQKNLSKFDKSKTIITCCASGMRSSSAKSILKRNGFNEVHNGGAWTSLNRYVN